MMTFFVMELDKIINLHKMELSPNSSLLNNKSFNKDASKKVLGGEIKNGGITGNRINKEQIKYNKIFQKLKQEKSSDFWKSKSINEVQKDYIQIYEDNVKFFFSGFFLTVIIIFILIIFRNEDFISDRYQNIFCSNE